MKFNPKYFEKKPIEIANPETGRLIMPKLTRLFHSYSLKEPPQMSVEQAHGLLKDKAAFDKLPVHDKVGIQQVIANNQADRLGIPRPEVKIFPNYPIVGWSVKGLASGNSVYSNAGTLNSQEWSHNTPVHETTHLWQTMAENGKAQNDKNLLDFVQTESGYNARGKDILLHPIKFALGYFTNSREQDARNKALQYQKEHGLPGDFEKYEKMQERLVNFEKKHGDGWGAVATGARKIFVKNLKSLTKLGHIKSW
ncbi:MAG: hypothetical protein FWE47_02125, partial [Oscillospiraceae bacterium]|nr:hypothetical protein [Oscillospiraceae bacterium]